MLAKSRTCDKLQAVQRSDSSSGFRGGIYSTPNFRMELAAFRGRGTSALRFKFEQGLLCLQRAELATDCKQCKEATASRDFGVGFIPHRIFGWNSPPLGGEEHLHLDYRTLHGFFQVY